MVEFSKELREAKEELRDFERNIDSEMPNLQRLKEFKSLAQEMIENPKGRTRRHQSQRRTQREVEELYEKLREYQAQHPHMDLSGLFENYEADRARLAMHKRALQSYKKFEFLKAGTGSKSQPEEASNKTRQSDVYEPFNYPGLQDSVAQVFTDGTQLKVANTGSNSNYSAARQRKGRRFDRYSEHEFLEDYLGKDYVGRPDLSKDPYNEVFSYHGTLRELFPDEKQYLKMPKVRE